MIDHRLAQEVQARIGERVTERQQRDEAAGGRLWDEDDVRQVMVSELGVELGRLDAEAMRSGQPTLTPGEAEELRRNVLDRQFGLGAVQRWVDMPNVTDVEVRGYDYVRIVHRDGTWEEREEPLAESNEDLVQLVKQQADRVAGGHRWDATTAKLDLQLPSGHRLHAIFAVTNPPNEPAITIRRHDYAIGTFKEIRDLGGVSRSIEAFLTAAMLAGCNIMIGGSTGAGKSTLARAMINALPRGRNIITVEDTNELDIRKFKVHRNVTLLTARDANIEGRGEFTIGALLKQAMRMNPDHLIVGEFRGPEVRDALMAMNHGDKGASLSTVHADSIESVFNRLQVYMSMAEEHYAPEVTNLIVANAVNLVVHMSRSTDGARVVSSVYEVTGARDRTMSGNDVYVADDTGRGQPAHHPSDRMIKRLTGAGFDMRWLEPANGGWEL